MTHNKDFSADADLDRLASAIDADGYAVVHGVIDGDTRAQLSAQLAPHIQAAEPAGTAFLGSRTRRVVNLLARSQAVHALALHPIVMAIADRVLLPYCARYRLGYTGVMHLEPGEQAQQLHRDGRCYPIANPGPPLILATMWALSDFVAANGATRLVPGSHRWDDERQPREDEIICAEMPAGSVLLYTSGVLHGGGANVSSDARTGIALHYALGWLRQVENHYLSLPPEQARQLPSALQRLIGYDYGGPFLGLVDGDDPHRVLEDGAGQGARRTTDQLEAAHAGIRKLRVADAPPG
jgi:ectoine hydroxylase-related dioxygenase (phytanoyl-CoA dioxygenase family)